MSPDTIEQLLADFRTWLHTPAAAPAASPAVPEMQVDLADLVAPFVALRHEVNLQTKASRAQLEQNAQMLDQLRQALEMVRRPSQPVASADDTVRSLLKTLVDIHDALVLARREVLRLRESLPADDVPPPPPVDVPLPFWARWLGLETIIARAVAPLQAWQRARVTSAEESARLRPMVDAMRVGYDMSVQRIERTLGQSGLERIECVGEPFDPETMEVAEVVRDPARSGTEVIDEVRPGYRWRGRLLRYAQVRVARP